MKNTICFCLVLWVGALEALNSFKMDVEGKAAILLNAETGAILFEKNAHQPLYPASLTKVITALYALEMKGGSLDELVMVTPDAVAIVPSSVRRAQHSQHPPYRLEYGGSQMGIEAGEVLSFRSLLYGLMLVSGNDAANVIAEYVSGNVSQFMNDLNLYVRQKGCRHTRLYTPHGLPHPEHKTTAYDLGILTTEALKHPFFREVVKTERYLCPATNKRGETPLLQYNALVAEGKFFYPKAIGVKTGYTASAGFTLAAAAADSHRKLVAILLGYENRESRYKDAIALFEMAFNEKAVTRTLFSKGFDRFHCLVEGAKAPLQADLSQNVTLTFFPSEEPQVEASVCWDALELPIFTGQQVGKMHICSLDKKVLLDVPLVAARDVYPTRIHLFCQKISAVKGWLQGHLASVLGGIGVLFLIGVGWRYIRPYANRDS